jgi:hypothetical protein
VSAVQKVALIGCSGKKLDRAAPARELYVSALFRKAVAYAEAAGMPWAVLSAKHGVVLPDTVLEPYDVKKRGKRSEIWAHAVRGQLDALFPNTTFVLLAGENYRPWCGGSPSLCLEEPLKGLSVGQRLAWLGRETELLTIPTTDAEIEAFEREAGPAPPLPEGFIERTTRNVLARIHRDVKRAHVPCDFCGESDTPLAVSELGDARFPGDDTPARICARCATWALKQLRGVRT